MPAQDGPTRGDQPQPEQPLERLPSAPRSGVREALGGLVALAVLGLVVGASAMLVEGCKSDEATAADGDLAVPDGGPGACADAIYNEFSVQQPHTASRTNDGGARANYFGVWGASDKAIWAVGDNGRIVFYNGTDWVRQQTPTSVTLTAVSGVSDKEVWAVGFAGTVLKFDGTQWTDVSPPVQRFLETDAGVAPGPDGAVAARRNLWGAYAAGRDQGGVVTTVALYVAGDRGTVLHLAGTTWTRIDSGVEEKLTGMWGTGENNVYIVGDFGTVLKGSLLGFAKEQTGVDKPLRAVWGRGNNDVYAVGLNGMVLHRGSGGWRELTGAPKQFLRGVWGPPNNNRIAYIVGWDGMLMRVSGGPGFANGADFDPFFCTTNRRLEAIWGTLVEVPKPAPDAGLAPGQDAGLIKVPRVFAVGVSGTVVTGP